MPCWVQQLTSLLAYYVCATGIARKRFAIGAFDMHARTVLVCWPVSSTFCCIYLCDSGVGSQVLSGIVTSRVYCIMAGLLWQHFLVV
jgi:hypothetical protein